MYEWQREEKVRRMAQSEALERIMVLNQKYEANDCHGATGEGANFEVFRGEVPTLVSAPHAVKQWREGRIKYQDGITGGIVEYLVEKYELYGVTRIWEAGDDPNYGDDERSVAYRDEIVEMVKDAGIKWVFDIHGCRDAHGFDMDIGVNGGENVVCGMKDVKRLAEVWRDEGLDVRIDGRFRAARSTTVSNDVHQKTGVDCLQIELAEKIRMSDEGMGKFLRGMERVLAICR